MARDVTVKATFAGDSSSLEKTFANVGSSAKKMATDLDSAEGKAKSFGGAIEGAGGAVGNQESRFMGTADLLDGLGGAFGLPTEGATGMMRAFGDLSGGFEVVSGMFGPMFTKLGTMIGLTGAQATATGTATASQWSLNAALTANPIGVVVLAIAALVAGFILAWKHSETFRNIVTGAFNAVKDAAIAVWDFIKVLPEKLMGVAGAIKDAVLWPYKTAFNLVAKAWNSTVGRLDFHIPDWVPGMGGKGFSMPKLPEFHKGGIVPGPRGAEVPILAMAGETVTPAGGGSPSGPVIIQLVLDGRVVTEVVHNGLLQKQRRTPLGLVS